MSPAAARLAALSAIAPLLAPGAIWAGAAADEPTQIAPRRAPPSRPSGVIGPPVGGAPAPLTSVGGPAAGTKSAPLSVTRIKQKDYFTATEIAARLGFKTAWDEAKRELTLTGGGRRLVLTAEKREVLANGLRIFLGDAVLWRAGKLLIHRTDYEGGLLPLLRPDALSGAVPKVRTIVLDPGHGGADPGMENNALRVQEKVLALDVALRLEKLLLADGYSVVLTRKDDRQLASSKDADLQRRAIIANAAGADLFLSIHFNSLSPNTQVSGTEVYVFTRAGQRSDTSWGFGQPDDTEKDLAPVNHHDPWTSLFAHAVHRETIAGLKTSDRGHKTKHLAVLRGLNCPGVLVEALFLSNPEEARRAATPAYRQQIAASLLAGIRSYAAAVEALRPKLPAAPPATAARPTS